MTFFPRARMGELLQATERAKGGEQYHRGSTHSGRESVPTLAELGVTRKESMEAQAAAERAKGTRGAGRPKLGNNQRELPKNALAGMGGSNCPTFALHSRSSPAHGDGRLAAKRLRHAVPIGNSVTPG